MGEMSIHSFSSAFIQLCMKGIFFFFATQGYSNIKSIKKYKYSVGPVHNLKVELKAKNFNNFLQSYNEQKFIGHRPTEAHT